MNKYILEEDIDFFSEINKSINLENEENSKNEENNNICLITQENLQDNAIKLSCNHYFNYIPLLKEIFSQKFVTNYYKKYNSIKKKIICPYCRNENQNFFIPFVEELYDIKVFGLNTDNPFYTLDVFSSNKVLSNLTLEKIKKCEYITESGIQCNKPFCFKSYLNIPYCKMHRMHKTKEETKQVKEAKYCFMLLKTGKNAGKPCNCKITDKTNNTCKRHIDFINKS
jgi:hypothetical protein